MINLSLPSYGTVFVHVHFPQRPLIVSPHHAGDDTSAIYRVDLDGVRVEWGRLEDWNDELRRGTLKIVYDPFSNNQ